MRVILGLGQVTGSCLMARFKLNQGLVLQLNGKNKMTAMTTFQASQSRKHLNSQEELCDETMRVSRRVENRSTLW